MRTILISTSQFGTPIPDYFKYLGEIFNKNKFTVIFIFDGSVKDFPPYQKNIKYFSYPSKRPTRLKDFIFLYKIIKQEKPILCISNFGSTNIVTLASFLLGVSNRVNYLHTSPYQLSIDSKKSTLSKWLLKQRKTIILKTNTHIITNSNTMSKLIIHSFKLKKSNISVMPYLLEDDNRPKKKFKDREKKICIVGRLAPSKGHKELLYSFANCKDIHKNIDLLIVGDGPEEKNLKDLSRLLKVDKHIKFVGSVPNKEVGDIFSNCLASISASKSEAFGIVSIESLKEGTPILSTYTEGSRDIIKEGKNGLLVNLNKENDFSEKLSKILDNWDFYSKNALKTFENKFSKKNINNHYEKFMNEILIT